MVHLRLFSDLSIGLESHCYCDQPVYVLYEMLSEREMLSVRSECLRLNFEQLHSDDRLSMMASDSYQPAAVLLADHLILLLKIALQTTLTSRVNHKRQQPQVLLRSLSAR